MSSVGGIKAGRAYVAVGADDSELRAVLKRTEARLNATAKTIRTIGASMIVAGSAVGGGLLAAAVSAGKLGDHLNDLRAKTGVNVEALAGLDIAASTSGSSLDALAGDIYKMNRVVGEAAGGSKSAVDALAELGVTLADLQGLSPDKQFGLFADKIAALESPSLRASAASKIFGRASGDLMTILLQGSRGMKDFQAQADALGHTLTFKTVAAVGEFDDALARTKKQVENVKLAIGAAIASALLPYEKSVAETLKTTIEWVVNNQTAIQEMAMLGVRVLETGAAMVALGKSMQFLSASMKLLGASSISLGAALNVVGLIVGAAIIYNQIYKASNLAVKVSLDDYTAAADSARATDIARLSTLKELAGAGKLNGAQMSIAATLIKQLEAGYGSLGVSINSTTGAIVGMADAWQKVVGAMKEATRAQLEKGREEAQKQFWESEKKFREQNKAKFSDMFDMERIADFQLDDVRSVMNSIEANGLWDVLRGRGRFIFSRPDSIDKRRAKETIAEQEKLLAIIQDYNRRIKEVESDNVGALTGGAAAAPTLDTSGMVTSIESVGTAAIDSSDKINRWAEAMRMAQRMADKMKAGEDFLLDLSGSHARATGNDVFADSLETVREFKETLDALKSHPFLTDEQKRWAGATAMDAAESQLERIRAGLNQVSHFSVGTSNSNAIFSLNRGGGDNTGMKFLANQQKQQATLDQMKDLLLQIASKPGLVLGP